MPDDDDLERRVRKLAVEHAETRWLALRIDDDVKDVKQELRVMRDVQAEHGAILAEHTARFDSVDAQLRSLTQLVGQVLDRMPDDQSGD